MLRAICMSCWEKYCAVRSGAFLRRKTQTGFLLWQKWTTFHRTRNCDFIITLAFEHIFLVLLIAKRSFQSVCVHFEQSAKLKIFSLASTTANLADLNALPYTKLMPLFCTCSCVFLVCELYGQFFAFAQLENMTSKKSRIASNLEVIALSDCRWVRSNFTLVEAPLFFFRVKHEPMINPFATKSWAYFNGVCQVGQLPSSDVVVSLINAVAWPFSSWN